MQTTPHRYTAEEEHLNVLTHASATLAAIAATGYLCFKAMPISNKAVGVMLLYGASMTILFGASSCYHRATNEHSRFWLKKLDHTAIYYLIAGTYTPFLALYLPTERAKMLLWALWGIALVGTVFKLRFAHRFQKVSLAAYIIMGWLALLVMQDMHTYLSKTALTWLVLGGGFYTVGTLFYAAKKYPYTHAIWHVFVVLGAASHFYAIASMLPSVR